MSVVRSAVGTLGVLIAAAATVVVTGGTDQPAVAAACPGDSGVTVVVDYAELGGLQVGCAQGAGGRTASTAFAEAGFALSHVDRGPGTGMVCKVAGAPSDASCTTAPPAEAYWSLWIASPTSDTWGYASRGVTQLTVVDGGYVAFAWHQGSGTAQPPAVTPRRSTPVPPPSTAEPPRPGPRQRDSTEKVPAARPSARPTVAPTTPPPSAAPTPGAEPSATPPLKSRRSSASARPVQKRAAKGPRRTEASSDVPTVDDVTEGPPENGGSIAAEVADRDDGLPWWVPGIAVALVAAAGGTVVARRRR